MVRKAFKMKVYPDQHGEYYQRHQKLWPEMEHLLREHGVLKYGIFLDEQSSELFAYLEVEDQSKWDQVASTEMNQKWWDYMAPIMETNPDNSPITQELSEMFYIEK
ncbi:L-rhamnose mutarotase [Amphibacillus sediminis]|uniref:L-rhamnose mutarotase n=1 Tax=Amphibacillus sediminis TaxID=360185 RepID=UPI00082D0C82|nr:L-rhamnose mutarotase [Amphibacillus sediminis]